MGNILTKVVLTAKEELDKAINKLGSIADDNKRLIEENKVAKQVDLDKLSSQMDEKANKNSVFSMANMGQDVKEAMTGGSVAVVGVESVSIKNLSFNIQECIGDLEEETLAWTTGSYYNKTTGISLSSAWQYCEVICTSGERIYITSNDRTVAPSSQIVYAVDDSGNRIDGSTVETGQLYDNYEYVTPVGTQALRFSCRIAYPTKIKRYEPYKVAKEEEVSNIRVEIDNSRIGVNNIKYDTMGDAIRKPLEVLNIKEIVVSKNYINTNFVLGKTANSQFTFDGSYTYIPLNTTISAGNFKGVLSVTNSSNEEEYPSNMILFGLCDENKSLLGNTAGVNVNITVSSDTAEKAKYVRLTMYGYKDNIIQKLGFFKYTDDYDEYSSIQDSSRLVELEKNFIDLSNKYCNFVGDSITEQQRYVNMVLEKTGIMSTGNKGVSSSTIAVNNSYLTNKSIVERVCGLNGNTQYENADVWCVFGGINDFIYNTPLGSLGIAESTFDNTTFYGALQQTIENILKRSNSPKLILITPLQSIKDKVVNTLSLKPINYVDAIVDVANYYSIPCVDLWRKGGLNRMNLQSSVNPTTNDGLHPNLYGASIFSNLIAKEIKMLDFDYLAYLI